MPMLVDIDDVRMPCQAQRLGLAPQTVGSHGLMGGHCPKELDGDPEAIARANGFVDDAASA